MKNQPCFQRNGKTRYIEVLLEKLKIKTYFLLHSQ